MKFLGIAAMFAALGGCGMNHMFDGPQVQGSGKIKTESRKVGSFTEIVSEGSANCKVTVGKAQSISVRADDNILPLIETKVEGKKLIITSKGSYSTKGPIEVTVTVPNLEAFETRGSGDSEITGIRGRTFAGRIAGSGELVASGQVENAALAISGSGDMDFSGLRTKDATAGISGSGEIQLHVTGNLTASVSGSGSIRYSGNPKSVQRNISGSGEIESR